MAIPRADIFSFEGETADLAVMTYVVNGGKCRVAFGDNQLELIENMLPRIRRQMAAQREVKKNSAVKE